jgi:hypothetical protein
MDVVGYLNHADLLLENEQGVAIVGTGHYVLSLGDKVELKGMNPATQLQRVEISFASAAHQNLHEDELCLKFEGSREKLKEYLHQTTVH